MGFSRRGSTMHEIGYYSDTLMIAIILSFLDEFRRHFRVADAVDIVLMSAIVYGGLIWFKQAASRRVLSGIIVVLVLFFVARAFDMYLVSLMLQTGFAVLIIIVVVIFQEDLRRMFERIAGIRWRGRSKQETPQLPIDLDAIVEATFAMAAAKTGALIVLVGAEPIERHIDGGVALNGRISQPLLFSVFDASSPGHDGAVVIDKGRIERFAAHLPISKNHEAIAGRGTRHSAALGLAESCDAMIVVVSEERGVVSIGEAGQLTEITSSSSLKDRIESFFQARFAPEQSTGLKQILLNNGWLKLLALALTTTAWFVLAYNPTTIQRTFVVPVEYRNLTANRLLDDDAPTEARVTLSGSERNFRFLEPGTLKISIDLGEAGLGFQEIAITDRQIRLPLNLALYRIDPRVIRLELRTKSASPPKNGSP
jgi:uncharacterized protein (TIGR00159 family)